MIRSATDKRGSRKSGWWLGRLDVLSRGSDTRTLKKEGARSVCGTEIQSVCSELS